MLDPIERILSLVTQAIDELDSGSTPLSSVISKSIRIARLRNDYENLWWLELEVIPFPDKEGKRKIIHEILPHFSKDRFERKQKEYTEAIILERTTPTVNPDGQVVPDRKQIQGLSIPEIETKIKLYQEGLKSMVTPQGLHPVDAYHVDQENFKAKSTILLILDSYFSILSAVKRRVSDFLSLTEKQLIFGQINSDIFEQNRQYVDSKLSHFAPEILEQLACLYKRAGENNPESRSQALTTCRRIIKALADKVFPPSDKPYKCLDGTMRNLNDAKYLSRLWEFVASKVKGTTSGVLILAQIDELGSKIDKIHDLSCKGVHADVSQYEVNQCVIQTYLLIGDVFRIYEGQSAFEATIQEIST